MAQPSSLRSPCDSSKGFQSSVQFFDRNQGPSPEAACPPPSLFSSSSLCTARDLPTTQVSNCMYLAPLPIQSCYVTPSASAEALLVSLRGRNPHFCCVLQLTTGLQQRGTLPSAPVTPAGGAHEFQLADLGSPCPSGEPHFAPAAAGSFADLDAICSFQTTQSKEPNAALTRTVYVGWIGEFLSRTDEATFSAAMRLHTSQLCNTKEACSSFVPPHFAHSAAPDICESASTAVGGKKSCSSSLQFIGLSAALCDCYKLQPWEPVQVSFVHLDVIFAAAPHPPLPPLVSNKDYSATSSQFPFSAYPWSSSAACSSAISSPMAPSSGLAAKETLPLPPEEAVAAAPVSAGWATRPSSNWANGRSATSAEADDCGNAAAEHLVAAGSEGFVAAARGSSSAERAHVKAGWYPQLPWDVTPAFVEVCPAAEEDWEVVQLQSARIEEELLMQIAVVMPSIPFPLWPSKGYERPAKLVAIPKSSFSSGESSNNICEASCHRDNQVRGGHAPPRQRGFRAACGRGSASIMRSAAVKDGVENPPDRTPTAYREEATGAPSILAATSEPRISPEEASGAATTSAGAAYPPFVLLSRDTELHVRPFIPKPLGPKALPHQWTQSFSNSRVACDFFLPAKRAHCENVGVAERIQNITAASEGTTEALRTGKSCHTPKSHTVKTSSDTDSNTLSSMNNRNTRSSDRASSSSAKGNYSSSNASGLKRSASTAGARIADSSRAGSSHAIRLDWDRKSIAAATDKDKVPAAEAPTNTVPSFRMRVVAANSRHLRRPAWVPLLRMFRPGEVTKKAHADTCVQGKRGGPEEEKGKKVDEEGRNSAGLAAGDSAKQNSLGWGGRHTSGNNCGGEGPVTPCAPLKSPDNIEMTQEEISACEEDVEDDDEDESLDHSRCHACWMHPCHVVALQKQQPWLQASLRQAAAADRSSLVQRLLNRSTIGDKALSKEHLSFAVSPTSCACRPSSSVLPAGAASVAASTATATLSQQQSHATAAYVWVSLVVPPERSSINTNKRGGPAARTALTGARESAAGQGTSETEAGDDSTAVPLTATAAGLFVPTPCSSWKRAALSGLLLLKALPDGRVAPGSVALPLHIRRVYSFPLCSFVFITPCTSVPTLPRSIFAIPLCPASLGHVGPVAGVVTSRNSPSPARTTASEHVAAATAGAGANARKIHQTHRFMGDRNLAKADENNCLLRVPTLLEYLRTPRGRKDLKDAINKQLQTLAVENSSISCGCVANIAACAATTGAVPGSAVSLIQTAVGAEHGTDGKLIYYECSREESAGKNSVFPFALWEGAVLQVPLVLPQSVVAPKTAAESAGSGESPAGSVFSEGTDTRGKTLALSAAAAVSADTVCGITAAKSGAAAATTALVSMTAISHSSRPSCSTKTRHHRQADAVKDSRSENQTTQEPYGVNSLPLLGSCMACTKKTTEVFLRKTPGHKQEKAWLGCRQNVPAADGEDAKAPGKSCDFVQGRLTRSGADGEAVFLDDNVTSMLREGLQDLYISSSTENNAAAEGEDGECNSDVPVTGAKRTHGRVIAARQQEVAAPEEKQFVRAVHGCVDSSPDSDSSFGRSTNMKNGDDAHRIGRGTTRGRSKYSKSYSSTCAARYRSQEVVLRNTASRRSSSSYAGTLTGSPSHSEVRKSEAGGPSDSVSQRTRNNCKSRVPTRTSHSNTPEVGSSTKKNVLRRKAGSGGLVNGRERSSSPLRGRKSQTSPADCRIRDERDVRIKEGSSRDFPADLRTVQAVWAQEALLFEEAVRKEGEIEDEETAGDEGEDDEELETENEEAAAGARTGQDKQAMTHGEGPRGKGGAAGGPLFFTTRERKHPQTSAIVPRRSSLVAVQQEEQHHMTEKRSDNTGGKAKSRYATTATDASVASSADEWAPLRSNPKRHYVAADSSSDFDPSSLMRRSRTQQPSVCSSHGTHPPHRRRHGGGPGGITIGSKSPIMRTSRITGSKIEADCCSRLVHVVMVDVVVAFRSVFLPCFSGDVRTAESKPKGAQAGGETQPVLEGHRTGEYPCRDDEAREARDGITLPQLPADVLPMAISLATQEHPLEFLFDRRACRRACSSAFSRSAPYNVCNDIDSTDVGRSTRSRNVSRSKSDWAGRHRGPPAFVLCDAGFLQKCEQGKIPLQVLDPVVLLHASSSAEVASIRAAASRAASSLSKDNDFEGGQAATTELKRDRKVSASSAASVVASGEISTIYQHRTPKDSLIQSSGATEVRGADVFCKARARKGQRFFHAAGDAASSEGGCSSENRCRITLECGNHKPWCISSSCRGRTSTTNTGSSTNITNTAINANNERSCFSPCLVLEAEQQSLSYTQWWLCDAVLRSRRAAAAAAAAHQQDGPDRAAAELLHLIQLQCAEQLNPDLLDASAGEVLRYFALASRGQKSAVLRPSAKAAAAPPVLQPHPQVRPSHDGHESNSVNRAAAAAIPQSDPAQVAVDAAAASAGTGAVVASAVGRAPASCVVFLPRHSAAIGKPPTLATHRLVVRDLSFLAEDPAARSRTTSYRPSVAARAAVGAREAGGCSLDSAKRTDWKESRIPPRGRKNCIRTPTSFLESLGFHRELDEDEEDEDAAAGHNSANTLLLRLCTDFFENCPAQLVLASKPKLFATGS